MRSMLKKSLALILCLVMCLSLFPTAAFADTEIEEDAEWTDASDPVILSDSEESQPEEPADPVGDDAPGVPPEDPADSVGDGVPDVPTEDPAEPAGDDALDVPPEDPADSVGDGVLDVPTEDPAASVGDDALDVPENDGFDDPFALVEADEPQDVVASGTCGDNLTWTLDDEGTLTISGTGAMDSYGDYEDNQFPEAPWYELRSEILKIVIEAGVTSIGRGAFEYCSNLTVVTIPDSVVSLGMFSFYRCSSLTSITIPEGVTTITYACFCGCSSLTEVWLPQSLKRIEGYEQYGGSFENCVSLSGITLPDGVTEIGQGAFRGCSSLTSITIPEGVTDISSGCFAGCSNLTEVWLPQSLTTISGAFSPGGGGAFENCVSLSGITLPDGVTKIGQCAFRGCSALNEILFKGPAPSFADQCFSGVTTTAYYPRLDSSWTEAVRQNYGGTITWVGYGAYLVSYDANGGTGAPEAQTKLPGEALTLSEGVPVREGYRFLGWAANSTATEAQYQPGDSYTEEADVTLYAVWKAIIIASGTCGKNLTWTLDDEGTLTISGTGYMYQYYSDQDMYDPAPWSRLRSEIRRIVIKAGMTDTGQGAFMSCSNLTEVIIPDSVRRLADDTFRDCSSLTSITIPDSVTHLGMRIFMGCSSLTSITIPEGVTDIPSCCFYGCSSLTEVRLPQSLTTIRGDSSPSVTYEEGMGKAFYGCTGLTSIRLPENLTRIGDYAFAGCTGLNEILFEGPAPSFGQWNCFSSVTATAYYPRLDSSWTEAVRQDYGGTITWAGYGAYFVSYDANGGTGAPETQTKLPGEPLTLSETGPVREGYSFLGWAASSTATEAQYQPGDNYTADADVTLYAVWVRQYTIRFDANGGTGAPEAQTKQPGEVLTLSEEIPVRERYAFLGWATSSAAAEAQYQPGDNYTADIDVTLYAVWVRQYTIRFDANGGTGAPEAQSRRMASR